MRETSSRGATTCSRTSIAVTTSNSSARLSSPERERSGHRDRVAGPAAAAPRQIRFRTHATPVPLATAQCEKISVATSYVEETTGFAEWFEAIKGLVVTPSREF